jgi:DNA primase
MTEAADFKETVKQQTDIVRVVGDYVKLKKAGSQNYSGLCPFHNEKTASFTASDAERRAMSSPSSRKSRTSLSRKR